MAEIGATRDPQNNRCGQFDYQKFCCTEKLIHQSAGMTFL